GAAAGRTFSGAGRLAFPHRRHPRHAAALRGTTGDRMRVELNRVGRSFGAMQALAPVDLAIAEGEFIAIVGPSGCGKSTLLRIIAGLLPASEGEVLVGGRARSGPVTELGIVFQQPVL